MPDGIVFHLYDRYTSRFHPDQPEYSLWRDRWAVTLICAERNSHAQLIVEGIDARSRFFTKLLHLNGITSSLEEGERAPALNAIGSTVVWSHIGKVEVRDLGDREIRYSGNPKTWMVAADKVQEMIESAEQEDASPLDHPRGFCIFGRFSYLSPKISTYEVLDPKLQELYKEDREGVIALYNKSFPPNFFKKSCPDMRELTLAERLPIVMKRWDTIRQEQRGANPIPDQSWERVRRFIGDASVQELTQSGPHAPLFDEQIDCCARIYEEKGERYADAFIRICLGWMRVIHLEPDNCFTWALEKLNTIDIDPGSISYAKLVSHTRTVTGWDRKARTSKQWKMQNASSFLGARTHPY